jgi:hypothetical protein
MPTDDRDHKRIRAALLTSARIQGKTPIDWDLLVGMVRCAKTPEIPCKRDPTDGVAWGSMCQGIVGPPAATNLQRLFANT